jgi:alkylhydroperoxidase family enzyme
MTSAEFQPAFIAPPSRIPLLLRFGLWISRRATGEDVLVARLLTWYPRAAIGSGVLESLVAKSVGRVDERMLKIVRMSASAAVECDFCIGFNARDWDKHLTEDELAVVQGRRDAADVVSLDAAERLAIEYSRMLVQTPIAVPREFGMRLREQFTEREMVVLATTIAQVDYWARVVNGLGCPPLG